MSHSHADRLHKIRVHKYILCLKSTEGAENEMGTAGASYGNGFALIVVLFILLVIVGTAYVY